ncbi:metalloregulator ArsR/SmtB family transcription factor [Gluconacetobacter azotocaptans]|uniref:Metalloregulator ArsR/SmtB family transcription factor n=1 Tax=Gluconacetobacter azotocaptans TaxID=142834 RepID=A0A7W4JPH7_9PROT|nr:metalloregulator ArsR/SmtB family transcription factor [Gluconacetobacter azotocaptans]MBB2188524.1 metalloregulator ArsR/SmtB family transcription factor [Gluconacetobacter azotocaptans]GBQ28060.1 SAM-dependent methyltransferase [Gluconacetobacter azotocaptans DSM 13594]
MYRPLLIFQALADPTRLRILALLRSMELSVGEIAQVLGQSQPRVSRHVKILVNAGLAERRKEGSWVFLTLGPAPDLAPVFAAIDQWTRGDDPDADADIARLKAVRAVRASAAEDYFETHAAEWDAIRSLHVAEGDVEAAIERVLAPEPIGRLVDIGTGTGRMMELLGRKADCAIGFDRSPAMLRLARTKLAQAGLDRAELRQGDIYALPMPAASADVAIMHQVLHYAQHPAAAIAEAARLLDAGGRLLIVDFAAHDREDLRDRDAHVRLGFADDQMAAWFKAAGLSCAPPTHLDGELTVKLWLGRRLPAKL